MSSESPVLGNGPVQGDLEVVAETLPTSVPTDHHPDLDAAELRRQAEHAKAELQLACDIPVPGEDDDDEEIESAKLPTPAREGAAFAEAEIAPEANGTATGTLEEALCGMWISEKGEFSIFEDHMTSRLSYEELLGDGTDRLHGWLVKQDEDDNRWQATLMMLEDGQGPWYGPSFGEEPEVVGNIQVHFVRGSPNKLETQIRVAEEDVDWQPPVVCRRKPPPIACPSTATGSGDLYVFGGH